MARPPTLPSGRTLDFSNPERQFDAPLAHAHGLRLHQRKAAASPFSARTRATVLSASCSHCHSLATSASRARSSAKLSISTLHLSIVPYLFYNCAARTWQPSSQPCPGFLPPPHQIRAAFHPPLRSCAAHRPAHRAGLSCARQAYPASRSFFGVFPGRGLQEGAIIDCFGYASLPRKYDVHRAVSRFCYGAFRDQQPDCWRVTAPGGEMQRSTAVIICRLDVGALTNPTPRQTGASFPSLLSARR